MGRGKGWVVGGYQLDEVPWGSAVKPVGCMHLVYRHLVRNMYRNTDIFTLCASDSLAEEAGRQPAVVCGLLNHETKMSVLHFWVKKSESYAETIACKEELSFHCGFRRFVSR